MKRAILLLLVASMLAGTMASCGGSAATASDTTAGGDTSAADTAPKYDYPELDMEGETFTMMNTNQTYQFYQTLDLEEATGDSLDDAVYNRNRALEERYNFTFETIESYDLQKAADAVSTSVLAGDDLYDVAFLRDIYLTSLLTEGYLADLQDTATFRFNEPWWDTDATNAARIGKNQPIYFAFTDVTLVDFEGTVVTFFNENMMQDLGLEFPYQLVKDGKWTLDEEAKLMKAGASLNGQDSFAWNAEGTARYGMLSYEHYTDALIIGTNNDFFVKDKDGTPSLNVENQHFVDCAMKILEMTVPEGEYLFINSSGNDHYEMGFKNSRTLMITSQLKATNKYRDMNDSFGILPIPKLDEKQDKYRCTRSYTYVMCVPVTTSHLEETGVIMDAMSFMTYDTVMPNFYNLRISQKALRNDDSIEMLDIIRQSRYYDLGAAYGWSETIKKVYREVSKARTTDFTSQVAAAKPALEETIRNYMAKVNA